MSRSHYTEGGDNLHLWREAVYRAVHGRRGQAFLRRLLGELDAMWRRELITEHLVTDNGARCALGVILGRKARELKPDDHAAIGRALDIGRSLVQEIEFINDEGCQRKESGAERWVRVRQWVCRKIDVTPEELVTDTGGAT